MTANPATKVFCLSYIDHFTLLVMKIIDSGGIGNGSNLFGGQVGRQVLFPAFRMQHLVNRSLFVLPQYFFEKNYRSIRVTACAMPVQDRYLKFPAKLTQTVSGKSGKNFPAKANCAKLFGIQFKSAGFQLVFDK